MLTGVSFANVEDVVAVNLTLGEMSGPDDILLSPDGSFRGFIPVRPGKNRIRISAWMAGYVCPDRCSVLCECGGRGLICVLREANRPDKSNRYESPAHWYRNRESD